MMTELMHLAQQWLAFSLVLSAQLLLILMLRKPVRARLGAVACYRLWLLPVVWLPLYFLGPFLLASLATPDPVGGAPGSATPYQQALQQFADIELLPFDFDIGSTTPAASGDTKIHGWSVLAVLWAAGTVALILWHARRWLTFSREVNAAGLPLSETEKAYTGTSRHFPEEIPVLRLNAINSAALFGVFKPALLLPGTFTQRYDENQRHIILAHEAVHMRRGDNGWNLGALLLIALFWTNPLVYIAWRGFRLDQELSCDALALARCNKEQQKRYARTLLDSLSVIPATRYQPALSAWDNLGDIKERSLMVNHHMHLARRPFATVFSLLCLAAFGASLTIAFADLVSPVVQAAESAPLQTIQAIQGVQESQRAVQLAQQQLQEVQQGTRVAQQRLQLTQQRIRETQQRTQDVQQRAQETQQRVQEVQQAVQATQQQVQDLRQDVQGVQRQAQDARQDVQVAQRQAQGLQQDVQDVQQQTQEARQDVQATQQQVQNVQQDVSATRQQAQEVQQGVQLAQQQIQVTQQQVQEVQQSVQAVQQRVQQVERAARTTGQQAEQVQRPLRDPANVASNQTARILSEAIAFLNNKQYPEVRALLADLRLEALSSFERSRYEQLMFSIAMADEDYPGARGHLQAALDSGGLNTQESSQMRYQVAQLFVQEEKYADAIPALEAWIASESAPSGGAYYLLAASHYYLDQFEQALGYAEEADEVDRSTGVAVEAHLSMLAALYTKLDRFADAERTTAEIAKLFPREAPQARPNLVPQARITPDYPKRALALGLEGWVKVRFTVSETGEVIDAVVVDSKPRRVFDNAAIRAVSLWRYDPQVEDTAAVPHEGVETTFRFTLAGL